MTDRMRPRHGIALAAVVGLIVAAVVPLMLRSPATPEAEGRPSSTPGALVAVSTPAIDPVGPATHRRGVPVGWRHDVAGATAAAAGYVRTSELVAAVGPLERQDIIGEFTTATFGPSLTARTNGQLDDLLFALGARGHDAGDLTWREFPLAARLDTQASDAVTVEVWSVSVVLVAGGSVARQTWHTDTVGLVWQSGDWKVDRWASTAGPTPGLPSGAELSSVSIVQATAGWAPAVSGGS